MSTFESTRRPSLGFVLCGVRSIAVLAVTLMLASFALLAGTTLYTQEAYGAVSSSPDAEQVVASDDEQGASQEAEAVEETQIEDDAVPMAASLDGAMSASSPGVPLSAIMVVAIAAVAAFFLALMRKLNSNISEMNERIR